LLAEGDIVRIRKGFNAFVPVPSRTALEKCWPNLIYGPSYISLEYALDTTG